MRFLSFACASLLGAVALVAPAAARADAPPPDAVQHPFEFKGRALYVGGGAGALTDLRVPTENWSILATFPLASVLSLETSGFGFHFQAPNAAGHPTDSTALGIGVGLRLQPPASWRVRPYLAGRFEHIHMLFDPYDAAEARMTMGPPEQTSQHRWALAGAIGAEVAFTRRLRAAFEAGPTVFTGSGTNGGGQALLMLGLGF